MKKQKKGISLIVLVITIIVMLILASAVIISIGNTSIITKAKEAVDKTNAANNMYLSEMKLAERTLEKAQGAAKVKDKEGGVLRVENEGKKDETYYIESIDDLVAFSTSVNEGNTYEGKIVKLTQLLDFNSDKSYVDVSLKETVTTGEGFMPIGNYNNPFKGTFDGDGTEIRNLYINKANIRAGLFGNITDAKIKNLGLTGKILTSGTMGSIVAECIVENNDTYIQNCYSKVEGKLTAEYDSYIGGIVCFAYGVSDENKVVVEDCYNEGPISAEHGSAFGGIVAVGEYFEINRCYNTGKMEVNDATNLGGVVGVAANIKVYNSYNMGNIIVDGGSFVGGIAGDIEESKIYNVYNVGKIQSRVTGCTAGIVSIDFNCRIGNAFNIGEIEGLLNNTVECVGNSSVNIDKPLYYVAGRNIPVLDVTDKFISKTLSEMNSQAFVDELNENIKDMPECVKWKLGKNGHPVLDM